VRAGKELGISPIFIFGTHVDQRRCVRESDEARKLRNGDFGGRGHGSVHLWAEDVDAMFQPRPHGAIAVDPLTEVHITIEAVSTVGRNAFSGYATRRGKLGALAAL
jgi:hypothetical protein